MTAAVFSSQAAAQAAAAQVALGTPFATVASNTSSSGGGAQGCDVESDLVSKLPPEADLKSLATGAEGRGLHPSRSLRCTPTGPTLAVS